MKNTTHLARAAVLVSLAALMAGCKTTASYEETAASIPNDIRQRHPIVVREKAQAMTVFIGDRRGNLTPSQRAEVGALAGGWRAEASGGFIIDVPVGGANERAATSAVREIRSILTATGVPGHAIQVKPHHSQDPVRLGAIRISYPKMAAETGPCGLWPNDISPTYDLLHWSNKPYWNHGCALQRNLAAQVANPADLVQPSSETPALAARRSTVLEKYRKGESTATNYPDGNKGKISELGQ